MRARGTGACGAFAERPAAVPEWYVLDVDMIVHIGDDDVHVLVNRDDPTRRFMHGADVRIPREGVLPTSTACSLGEGGELHLTLGLAKAMGWFS